MIFLSPKMFLNYLINRLVEIIYLFIYLLLKTLNWNLTLWVKCGTDSLVFVLFWFFFEVPRNTINC